MKIKDPEILYRYRQLGSSWANTLIEITGRLWLSKSEGLNDPFDGLGFSYKYDQIEKFRNYTFRGKCIWSIICFTTKWNNPTMWAHYANNYTGLCFGYKKDIIENKVKEIHKKVELPKYVYRDAFLEPMNYVKEIPATFKTEVEPLTIKTRHWKYEDEWRLGVLNSYGNVNVKNSGTSFDINNALSEIIYTDKLKTNELLAIKNIVKASNLNIKFYKLSFEKGLRVMKREEVH